VLCAKDVVTKTEGIIMDIAWEREKKTAIEEAMSEKAVPYVPLPEEDT